MIWAAAAKILKFQKKGMTRIKLAKWMRLWKGDYYDKKQGRHKCELFTYQNSKLRSNKFFKHHIQVLNHCWIFNLLLRIRECHVSIFYVSISYKILKPDILSSSAEDWKFSNDSIFEWCLKNLFHFIPEAYIHGTQNFPIIEYISGCRCIEQDCLVLYIGLKDEEFPSI